MTVDDEGQVLETGGVTREREREREREERRERREKRKEEKERSTPLHINIRRHAGRGTGKSGKSAFTCPR